METYDMNRIKVFNEDYMNEQRQRNQKLSTRGIRFIVDCLNRKNRKNVPTPVIDQLRVELTYGKYSKFSDIFKGDLAGIPTKYIPKEFRRDFLYIIDRLPQYQYSSGYMRRSMRSKSLIAHYDAFLETITNLNSMGIFHCPIVSYLTGKIDPDLAAWGMEKYYHTDAYENIIAAELDLGNPELEETLRDIFLSDQNTNIVSRGMIRGIIKSRNERMYKLLADLLLAARLQEGLRQAICENMDCGTPEAFIYLFDVLVRNNLDRFASVKRAIATWTGICDENNLDRVNAKVLSLISECLSSPDIAKRYLSSNDSLEFYIALWSVGFYCVEDTLPIIDSILERGERNQKLTASYYLVHLDFSLLSGRIVKSVIERYSDDPEMLACYLPAYLRNHEGVIGHYSLKYKFPDRKLPPLTDYFRDTEEAIAHFRLLKQLIDNMSNKRIEFRPCIFPWYGVSLEKVDLITRLCFIAALIRRQEFIDEACVLIPQMIFANYSARENYIRLLLSEPKSPVQREVLIKSLADRETGAAAAAYEISRNINFKPDEYRSIEELFAYKSSAVRANVSELLYRQTDLDLYGAIERLVGSGDAQKRAGGLDLILRLSKNPARKALYTKARDLTSLITTPSSSEKILIDEITGNSSATAVSILSTRGFGLYNPDEPLTLHPWKVDPNILKSVFGNPKSGGFFRSMFAAKEPSLADRMLRLINKLDLVINANKDREIKETNSNETILLGHKYAMRFSKAGDPPFKELWDDFYRDEIRDFRTLLQMYIFYLGTRFAGTDSAYKNFLIAIFGRDITGGSLAGIDYENHVSFILLYLFNRNIDDSLMLPVSMAVIAALSRMPESALIYTEKRNYYTSTHRFTDNLMIWPFAKYLSEPKDDRAFTESFPLLFEINKKCFFNKTDDRNTYYNHARMENGELSVFSFLRAGILGIITEDHVFRAIFEWLDLGKSVRLLSRSVRDGLSAYEQDSLKIMAGREDLDISSPEAMAAQSPIIAYAQNIYGRVIDLILSVELRRGESDTPFSSKISSIRRIFGLRYFVRILQALDNEKLERVDPIYYRLGYGGGSNSKKGTLSHLLKVCYPLPTDTPDTLRDLLTGTDIREMRLIEAAMYAPQWIDLIGDYLGYDGFRSCCYYFMAHMNERFDDELTARIAKFTPLSAEELNNGAFDINWFREAYDTVGEPLFKRFYDSAKYITSGSKHARARKYADAVRGKLNLAETEAEINEKRNKDLLISYTLIPFTDREKELPVRYQFLQKFLKESKQFGAQRRASEALAVGIAMGNLAQNAGYSDVMRLTLAMESKIFLEKQYLFDGVQIDNYTVSVRVSDAGMASIDCESKGKCLSSVPAAIKKDPRFEEISEFRKSLKQQYSRTKQMLEQSMEDRTPYYISELTRLEDNPVIAPLIRYLVFIAERPDEAPLVGFLADGLLRDAADQEIPLPPETPVRVAHPFDLYTAGNWHNFQKLLFEKKWAQPFKQVFRELYVKTEEEMDAYHSLRYSGNQIQPQKTVALLKGRRWIADYEDGLQRVFYKEDLVARIYALADWFAPSDILAPTLEWVEFSNRKTGKDVMISEVPDIVFSEVMRDVDLAVSVAHAGGVDPETSHSTIEMRAAIVAFSMPLFRLTNVTVSKNFAIIKGSRAEYSVHLGSGVVHQTGGTQLNVLPVFSQARGRLFLPFLDEDPKTAEILSKIILFAEDQKIKDPSILEQIIARPAGRS